MGKTKTKKKNGKRKYRRNLVSNYAPSGIPTMRTANMRYVATQSVTSTGGALQEVILRANSVFDPFQGSGGHQPMSYDQWSALYNHYVVLGSKITIKLLPIDGDQSPGYCGIYLSDGTVPPYTSAPEFAEARKGTWKLIIPAQSSSVTLTNKLSVKKFFNVKDVKDNIDRLGASVTANPAEEAYYHFWYGTANGSTDTIRIMYTIDYIVQFSEPKDIAQST